ncbi:3'(2'),5'-bisphosphate nucleotidase [Saccharospirillum sp. MSK14-1]|uniref:3'(2'),5'-bisphosphate nucleotidase CysQ n=1 Tax=Saccharospirillum sp. MSK14-1 TaxID=1897632 RepID=UPI000D3446B2|nr:3'(2'),5'-bisphosphate nucleotidase CysQ [Saccharospirillum sp. MSK14-1]PTY36317.1 3'(2'),5'-bisphosphate nucleotidase [Saccharospirillum sp. MSK14-1]
MNSSNFNAVVELARNAGEAIMNIYQQDFSASTQTKADDSPLTAADLAAHQCIVDGLSELTPQRPILSEESAAIDWRERQQWSSYWLVDPLDGTKEFIKKNGEFTVNIALIENGEPVWGVVHAPALHCTYEGGPAVHGSRKWLQGEAQGISVAQLPKGRSGWRLVGSRSHQSDAFQSFVAAFDEPEIQSLGSSLKICLVAEGAAHLYPRLGPTSEWDTAAAHAVLRGAHGEMVDAVTGYPLRYNQGESLLNPYFIAAPAEYSLG